MLLPPSYFSVAHFKSHVSVPLLMTKKRRNGQQLEKPQFDFKVSETIHEETDNSELETEIECPSCQSIMTLVLMIRLIIAVMSATFAFICNQQIISLFYYV